MEVTYLPLKFYIVSLSIARQIFTIINKFITISVTCDCQKKKKQKHKFEIYKILRIYFLILLYNIGKSFCCII